MSEIASLAPEAVWKLFDLICSIPHPSGYETALAERLKELALENGLTCIQDAAGNLRIDRPAAPGKENLPRIIFQAHLDMVPVAEDENFDFTTMPITPYIDGDVVRARGTTLGGDNGTGVALAMALLLEKDLQCGPLSGLFTLGEEIGLIGAGALDAKLLDGKYLINLDCGPDGEATIGCAGGARQEFRMQVEYDDAPAGVPLLITLDGLQGGHSGECIHKNRGNAIKSLAGFLLEQPEIQLNSFCSGRADNAIPHEAQAKVWFTGDVAGLKNAAALFAVCLQKELKREQITLTIEESAEISPRKLTADSQHRLLTALSLAPNGAFEFDEQLNIVRTSSNLAAVFTEDDVVRIRTSQRSLIDSEREKASAMLAEHFALFGCSSEITCPYPGWTPDPESRLVRCCAAVWEKIHHTPLKLNAIHAGLESGILGKKNPDLELISLGPGAPACHTPREYVRIASMATVYDYLKAICGELV